MHLKSDYKLRGGNLNNFPFFLFIYLFFFFLLFLMLTKATERTSIGGKGSGVQRFGTDRESWLSCTFFGLGSVSDGARHRGDIWGRSISSGYLVGAVMVLGR